MEVSVSKATSRRSINVDKEGHYKPVNSFLTWVPVVMHMFETLESDTVRLSACLSANTILVVVHPDCETCVEEMATICRMQAERDRIGLFVFISSANHGRRIQDIVLGGSLPSEIKKASAMMKGGDKEQVGPPSPS